MLFYTVKPRLTMNINILQSPKLHLIYVFVLLFHTWGCDDEKTPVSPPVWQPSYEEIPLSMAAQEEIKRLIQLQCQLQTECAYYAANITHSSLAQCERIGLIDALYEIYEDLPALQANQASYNQEAVRCAISETEELMNTCDEGMLGENFPMSSACENFSYTVGDKGDGDSCSIKGECQADLQCIFSNEMCSIGTCGTFDFCQNDSDCEFREDRICLNGDCVKPPAEEGASCNDRDCMEGLACTDMGNNFICLSKKVVGQGADCGNNIKCEAGLVCAYESGKCLVPSQLNQPCELSESTYSFSTCQSGLYCANGRCQYEPSPGDRCGSRQLRGPLSGTYYCPYGTLCIEECPQENSECKSFTCKRLAYNTQACSQDLDCRGQICDEGICKPRSEWFMMTQPTEPCETDDECSSYQCIDGLCNPQTFMFSGGTCYY